jgi:hypothetical protein
MLSGWTLPSVTRDAEIDIYLVHASSEPEDYFFLFDFEKFVERSKGGVFVRPKLRVFAGRSDFGRLVFARQFRQVFADEFDHMRAALATKSGKRGWLDWNLPFNLATDLISGFVANVILAIALSVGRKMFGELSIPKILKSKSDQSKLEDEIHETKDNVESALARIDVVLHPELVKHAQTFGPVSGMLDLDPDAWPLPAYVKTHLTQPESGSWW